MGHWLGRLGSYQPAETMTDAPPCPSGLDPATRTSTAGHKIKARAGRGRPRVDASTGPRNHASRAGRNDQVGETY